MKKRMMGILTVLLAVLCGGALAACGGETAAELSKLTITGRPAGDTVEYAEGKTVQLGIAFEPENAAEFSVEWSSDNQAVASVDKTGKVTVLREGSALIGAKATGGGSF